MRDESKPQNEPLSSAIYKGAGIAVGLCIALWTIDSKSGREASPWFFVEAIVLGFAVPLFGWASKRRAESRDH